MSKISDYTDYTVGASDEEKAKFADTGKVPVVGKYTENASLSGKGVSLSEVEPEQLDWATADQTSKTYIKNKPINIGAGLKAGEHIKIENSGGWYVISYDAGGGGGSKPT